MMRKNLSFLKYYGKLFALGAITGVLITGCGGGSSSSGGSGGSPASTALGSYISNGLNGSFIGSWFVTGGASSAEAFPVTWTTTSTANTYAVIWGDKLLAVGIWSANSSPSVIYDLISTGWIVSPSTGTMVDSGDGVNVTFTATGEPAFTESVTKTSLTGQPISCLEATGSVCTTPGNYPAGAVLYTHTSTSTATLYNLWGGAPLTDTAGAALTALPTVGITFCDLDDFLVFQAITPAPAGGANNYNVFNTASCTAPDITTALSSATADTILIGTQATGNAAVPNVLLLSGATSVTWINGYIYGLRANNVWAGSAQLKGSTWTDENKISINAELVASGLTPL
jgi:hypothetical protein